MNKIIELRKMRSSIWNTAKIFLDEHRKDDGTLNEEDEKAYQKMETSVVMLGKEIERLERQAEIDKEIDVPMNYCREEHDNGPCEEASMHNLKEDVRETFKILKEMSALLSEFEMIISGKSQEEKLTNDASCLCDEAHLVTGLAYNCLSRIAYIKSLIV